MKTLETEWSKTKLLLIVLVIVIAVSIIFQLFFKDKQSIPPDAVIPEQPTIQSNSVLNQIQIQKITVTAKEPQFPASLPIFRIEGKQTLSAIAQSIALKQGLQHESTRNDTWAHPTEPKFLTYSANNNLVVYTNEISATAQSLDETEAIAVAQAFIRSNISENSVIPQIDSMIKTKYQTETNESYGTTLPGNSLFIIPFAQTTNNFPIFAETQAQQPIWIWVGPNYTVLKAEISADIIQTTQVGNGAPISFKSIKQLVTDGKGVVLEITDEGPTVPITKTILEATLTSATVEYRVDTVTNMLYPYLRFKGSAIFTDNSKGEIEISHQIVHSINTINLLE